jgi:hypothetical protein
MVSQGTGHLPSILYDVLVGAGSLGCGYDGMMILKISCYLWLYLLFEDSFRFRGMNILCSVLKEMLSLVKGVQPCSCQPWNLQ